jgi:hypothetical protein
MAIRELLGLVLSDDGWYCIAGLAPDGTDKKPRRFFTQSLDDVEGYASQLVADGYNAFFSLAKFKEGRGPDAKRTYANALNNKAFWLDIDCGIGKPYESQEEGLKALSEFCASSGLPVPTIVDSGRGLHVYWALTETLEPAEWKPIAERLVRLCDKHGLQADNVCTIDAVRILRIPDTLNFKADPPLHVTVVHWGEVVELALLKSCFGELSSSLNELSGFTPGAARPNELTMSLLANRQAVFANIVDKIVTGDGCKQLENILTNQADIEEPLWRAGLSIAKHCSDGQQAVHIISEQHPDYDPRNTERKVASIAGPYTCSKFESLNPKGCEECKYRGRIKSPIVLGNEVVPANESTIVEQEPNGAIRKYEIPELPYPYFAGKFKGIYRTVPEADPILVYENYLFVVKRLHDKEGDGECIHMRLHLPVDGVREFTIIASDIGSKEELRKILAHHGVVCGAEQMKLIMAYIIDIIKDLQIQREAEIMRNQFGWADDDTKIIWGSKEISATEVKYSPPSAATKALSAWMEPKGTLEGWKKCANVYNMPGFEAQAFGFLTGFGAPLMKFMGMRGALINLINKESGTGKSTVLKMCNSIIGHPEELMSQWKDTYNHKIHRLGLLNNFAYTCDEVTKMSGDEFSDFSYSITQGHNKGRMQSQTNAERPNKTTWATIGLCSSNASFYDKLRALKATPDGEMMRLIEFTVNRTSNLTKEEADDIFQQMYEHYGHAGPIFFEYVLKNKELVLETLRTVQKKIDKLVGLESRERYYSATAAANITGGLIAKECGLIDYDMARIFNWTIEMLKSLKNSIIAPNEDYGSTIGEFINENWFKVLVINDLADNRTGMDQIPMIEPKQELIIRIEPDTKKTYISAKHLRAFCSKQQIPLQDMCIKLRELGAYEGSTKKRMSKGTKIPSPPVEAFVFNDKIIDPESFIPSLTEKANLDVPVE